MSKKIAAALKYTAGEDSAPKVTAKGRGIIAEKIVETARLNDIPIKNDANLANILETLDLGTEIPVELYRTVAEVLAFIYRLNKKVTP